jgi:DNA segregation ATPase FtsK/SpoIIIE-like protein
VVASSTIDGMTRSVGSVLGSVGESLGSVLPGPAKAYAIVLPLAGLGAAGALAYIFRSSLGDAYGSVEEAVVTNVGLGVVPLGLWAVSFLAVLLLRPVWIANLRLWASTLALALAAVVAMSAVETGFASPLEVFTRGGEVSLGGDVAHSITGGAGWLAGLITAGFVAAASLLVLPTITVGAASGVGSLGGKLGLGTYLVSLAVTRTLGLGVVGLYGRAVTSIKERRAASEAEKLVEVPPEAMTPYVRDHTPFGQGEPGDLTEDSQITATTTAEEGVLVDPDTEPDESFVDEEPVEQYATTSLDEDVAEPAAEPAAEPGPDAAPNGAKVNRFWNKPEDGVGQAAQTAKAVTDTVAETAATAAAASAAVAVSTPILDKWASAWSLPGLEMLVDTQVEGISQAEMDETSEKIRSTLGDYGVEVAVKMTKPGPAVTMYGLEPGWIRRSKQENATDDHGKPLLNEAGRQMKRRVETKTRVKVDAIFQRERDLALALRTPSIRIESPVMGTSLVGLEVPNAIPDLVTLRSVMESAEFKKMRKKGALPIALGQGSGGETAVLDLARMPHLLVAGATGSGKSVCLNTIVSCLTMEKSPSELRLLLVDPKRVELTPYNGIPHLLTPVVVETDKVVPLFKAVIVEMFKRYRHMEQLGVRNIASYNAKSTEKMPYLVLVVDELADLMMTASVEVEQTLCRLAQLGRATGIHLIIATQRPSVDVLTGLIKANFPSRIAFGVTSHIDSRTILDAAGAEKLLGRGDMLYQPIDASRPGRVQGVFISDDEISNLVGYWEKTAWAPLPKVGLEVPEEDEQGDGNAGGASTGDDLMDRAMELAYKERKLSTSLLQRRLRIGYPRAARLMDELEDQGIVGPSDGSKSRDVIIG